MLDTPEKPELLPINRENIPADLKNKKIWINWRWRWKAEKAKWDKPPDVDWRHNQKTFDYVMKKVESGAADGIGIVCGSGGVDNLDIQCIDLDHCYDDSEDMLKSLNPDIIPMIDRLLAKGAWIEESPSWTGLHIWSLGASGTIPSGYHFKSQELEMYCTGHYITVTGKALGTVPDRLPDLSKTFEKIYAKVYGEGKARPSGAEYKRREIDIVEIDPERVAGLPAGVLAMVGGDFSEYEDDRSTGVFVLAAKLLELFWTPDEVVSLLINADYGCSAAAFDRRGNNDQSRAQWVNQYLVEPQRDSRPDLFEPIGGGEDGDAPLKLAAPITPVVSYEDLVGAIRKAESQDKLMNHVVHTFKKHREGLRPDQIAGLQGMIRDRCKDWGVTVPIADIRKMTRSRRAEGVGSSGENTLIKPWSEAPSWAQDWALLRLESDKPFYDLKRREGIRERNFNLINSRHFTTVSEEGVLIPRMASSVLTTEYAMPAYGGLRYWPGGDDVVTIEGVRHVNTYRKGPFVGADGKVHGAKAETAEEHKAIAAFRSHMNMLIPDRRERRILCSWFKFVLCNPGKRVGWMPVIQSAEGMGKSILARLCKNILGLGNVKEVENSSLVKGWTDYAEGSILCVIEEICGTGADKYRIVELLKTYITNDYISIDRKRCDLYNTKNFTSYLAFTNHKNALHITEGNRRLYVVHCAPMSNEEREALVEAKYFDNLAKTFDKHAGIILGWLQEWPGDPEFHPFGNAPDSFAKRQETATSRSSLQQDIEDLIEDDDDECISDDIISITKVESKLFIDGRMKNKGQDRKQIEHILLDMGYLNFSGMIPRKEKRRVKYKGGQHCVWLKPHIEKLIKDMSFEDKRKNIREMWENSAALKIIEEESKAE